MEVKVFNDIVKLLQDADWLYNYPMTQVFTRDVLGNIPVGWKDALEDLPSDALNGLPQWQTLEHWPSSLKLFLQECRRLSCLSRSQELHSSADGNGSDGSSTSNRNNVQLPQELTHGLSVKKKHEITTLLSVVREMLHLTGSRHIMDVGSGKGYIDSCIHKLLDAHVLGVEGNSKLMRSAEKHHWKLYGRCGGITFLNWYLSDTVETLGRANQLMSYLTDLNTSCSCQVNPKSKGFRTKNLKKSNDSRSISEKSSEICDESLPTMSECKDSPQSFPDSASDVRNENSSSPNTCLLLGLHACADLSPIIIKVFRDCVQASSLVLLSCCYHKMSIRQKTIDTSVSSEQKTPPETIADSDMHCECSNDADPILNEEEISEENSFTNFPMSQSLQEVFRQNNFHMSVFGLRLGAQMSGQNWSTETLEDHEYHMRNVAFRGILEAACAKEDLIPQKLRRRCVRKSGFADFSEYKKTIFENYVFQNKKFGKASAGSVHDTESTSNKDESEERKTNSDISTALDSCYEQYKHYFPLIEPLTGLQLALQPVIERLIQLDRLVYLKECNFSRVWLEKVFDAEISPRNIALLAVR